MPIIAGRVAVLLVLALSILVARSALGLPPAEQSPIPTPITPATIVSVAPSAVPVVTAPPAPTMAGIVAAANDFSTAIREVARGTDGYRGRGCAAADRRGMGARAQFRTGWFVESLLTELVIALVVRTRRSFYRSRPGRLLWWSTLGVATVTVALPYLPFGGLLGFTPLLPAVLALLQGITALYVLAAEATKRIFYVRYAEATH